LASCDEGTILIRSLQNYWDEAEARKLKKKRVEHFFLLPVPKAEWV
jgi:hypothetical protein